MSNIKFGLLLFGYSARREVFINTLLQGTVFPFVGCRCHSLLIGRVYSTI